MYELGYITPIIILIVVVVALIKAGCEDARNKSWHDRMVSENQRKIDEVTGRNSRTR